MQRRAKDVCQLHDLDLDVELSFRPVGRNQLQAVHLRPPLEQLHQAVRHGNGDLGRDLADKGQVAAELYRVAQAVITTYEHSPSVERFTIPNSPVVLWHALAGR